MVDPPLNSRMVLQRHGVPSRLIDVVIITHCHAGLFSFFVFF